MNNNIEDQAKHIKDLTGRTNEQAATIKDLHALVDELRSLKANLEETLEEMRRQLFGTKSERIFTKAKKNDELTDEATANAIGIKVKEHTRIRKPKTTRKDLYNS